VRDWLASPTAANSPGHSLRRWRYAPLIAEPQGFVLVGTGSMTEPFPAWVASRISKSVTRVNAIFESVTNLSQSVRFCSYGHGKSLVPQGFGEFLLMCAVYVHACVCAGIDRVPSMCSPERVFPSCACVCACACAGCIFNLKEWNGTRGGELKRYFI